MVFAGLSQVELPLMVMPPPAPASRPTDPARAGEVQRPARGLVTIWFDGSTAPVPAGTRNVPPLSVTCRGVAVGGRAGRERRPGGDGNVRPSGRLPVAPSDKRAGRHRDAAGERVVRVGERQRPGPVLDEVPPAPEIAPEIVLLSVPLLTMRVVKLRATGRATVMPQFRNTSPPLTVSPTSRNSVLAGVAQAGVGIDPQEALEQADVAGEGVGVRQVEPAGVRGRSGEADRRGQAGGGTDDAAQRDGRTECCCRWRNRSRSRSAERRQADRRGDRAVHAVAEIDRELLEVGATIRSSLKLIALAELTAAVVVTVRPPRLTLIGPVRPVLLPPRISVPGPVLVRPAAETRAELIVNVPLL